MVERVVVGPWKTNCYIYSSAKKECIIVDPGGSEAEIMARVDVLNMVPVGIALTHGHVDHLAGLAKLQEIYAARGYKLPVAINFADRNFLGTGGRELHRESLEFLGIDEGSFFGVDPAELPKADVRLKDGDRVFDMDLVVLETPGHTPGSVCFYSEKEGILLSGDTLFFDGVGRTDLPGGNERKLRDSIQKKIAVLPPETRVFPGHGPFTTVEREKRGNIYMKSAPEKPRTEAPIAAGTILRPAASTAAVTPPRQEPAPAAAARAVTRPAPKAGARPVTASPAKAGLKTAPKTRPVSHRSSKPVKTAKGSAKAKRPVAVKPPTAKRAALKRSPAVQRPSPAKRPPAKRIVKTKSSVTVKPAQATRSTKAPGSRKKPAR